MHISKKYLYKDVKKKKNLFLLFYVFFRNLLPTNKKYDILMFVR